MSGAFGTVLQAIVPTAGLLPASSSILMRGARRDSSPTMESPFRLDGLWMRHRATDTVLSGLGETHVVSPKLNHTA